MDLESAFESDEEEALPSYADVGPSSDEAYNALANASRRREARNVPPRDDDDAVGIDPRVLEWKNVLTRAQIPIEYAYTYALKFASLDVTVESAKTLDGVDDRILRENGVADAAHREAILTVLEWLHESAVESNGETSKQNKTPEECAREAERMLERTKLETSASLAAHEALEARIAKIFAYDEEKLARLAAERAERRRKRVLRRAEKLKRRLDRELNDSS